MRTIPFIERKKEVKSFFSHDILLNSIFYRTYPVFTDTPFQSIKFLPLSHLKVTYFLKTFDSSQSLDTLLSKVLSQINGKNVENMDALRGLSPFMFKLLFDSFIKGMGEWQKYLFSNIEEFCKESSFSKIQWSIVENNGIAYIFKDNELTLEQKVWITCNNTLSKDSKSKFILDLRESLLPWFNNELWKVLEKRKQNYRENSDYENQKNELRKSQLSSEDLDEIK